MFCNLVLLNVCKYFTLPTLLYSLRVSAVLDHFGYPAPHLDQWQQHVWYDLGATQEVLHQMRIRLSRGLPTIASPPRAESPPPSRRPAAVPICPNHGREFVKASKGESSAPSTANTGPSSPVATTSPKTEIKKKRKRKSVKRTVTSETVSPPEKKKKIISESPDSQAEGPFLRFRHNECARGLLSCHLVVTSTICMSSFSGYSPCHDIGITLFAFFLFSTFSLSM